MNTTDITMVRIYLTESQRLLDILLKRLHDEERVMGVTVFRGISGFGKSGKIPVASLLDLSLNLPLVVEFFDTPQRVNVILDDLQDILESGHVVTWSASMKA